MDRLRQELVRKGVTFQPDWQEYRREHPDGCARRRFCEFDQQWAGALDPVLRQVDVPAEKLFVDWAGQKVEIHNPVDGSTTQAHLFVAVLGASNKVFAEAFPNEQLDSWTTAPLSRLCVLPRRGQGHCPGQPEDGGDTALPV